MENTPVSRKADIEAVILNAVAETVPKWRTFELPRWMQNFAPVNVGP
jgi:hypothetical protein